MHLESINVYLHERAEMNAFRKIEEAEKYLLIHLTIHSCKHSSAFPDSLWE